jgi:Stress responsive A/B Barrel Domain
MLRHVVLISWTPEASDEQKERVLTELRRLPALIPSIRALEIGPSAGINPGAFDFGLVADFDDADGYRAYRDDPEHRAIIDRFINPIAARRASTQYEF